MRIGIDVDDTITNSWESLLPHYSHLFNIDEHKLKKSKPYYMSVKDLITLDEYFDMILPIYDEVIPKVKLKDNVKGTLINKEEKIIWKPQKEFKITINLCYAPGKDYINFKYKEIYIEIYYKNSFIKSEYIEDENIYEYIKHLNEEESLIETEEEYDMIKVEKEYREIDSPYSRYNF